MKLLWALKLRNTVFTREVLVQQHGAVVSNVIASCRDSLVAYWMKAMTRTLPVATYLHTINPIKHSPLCTQCDQGGSQKESLSHFLSTCPKFHHARTLAHNQVCKVLAASLQKHLAAHTASQVTSSWNSAQSDRAGLRSGLHCNCAAAREASLGFRHYSNWKMATWFYSNILPN